MITGLYAGIAALVLIPLIINIARNRYKYQVAFGDGGNDHMLRLRSAHGNFIETVPMALIIMAIAEYNGAPVWSAHLLGLLLVVGRISHYIGITTGKGYGLYRATGMILTMLVYLLGGLLNLWLYLG